MGTSRLGQDGGTGPRRIKIGEIVITPFVSSRFRLDGGSMFGVVPKAIWRKLAPPDALNRITLNCNSLLVEAGGTRVLIEPGMGSKYDRKLKEIYGLAGCDVLSGLAALGIEPGEIDTVVPTHLHLDHAGGCTAWADPGKAVPSFPNARVVVQRAEWEAATSPHPLSAASYQPGDFTPLLEGGALELVDGVVEVAEGLRVELTGGHTPGHQVVRIRSGGSEALFVGDIVPTTAHLKLNWLMAWDLEPLVVYEARATLLEDCARRGVMVFSAHDPEIAACRLREERPGSFAIEEGSVVEAVFHADPLETGVEDKRPGVV